MTFQLFSQCIRRSRCISEKAVSLAPPTGSFASSVNTSSAVAVLRVGSRSGLSDRRSPVVAARFCSPDFLSPHRCGRG